MNLKPCPFCGGEATTLVEYNAVGRDSFIVSAYVKCKDCCVSKRCAANIHGATFERVDDLFNTVANQWNMRSEPQIVRCKDCKHWQQGDDYSANYCELIKQHPDAYWFCGDGEKNE